jgi:hypothetical protein
LLKGDIGIASLFLDQLRTPLFKMISFVEAEFSDETVEVKQFSAPAAIFKRVKICFGERINDF